jgi:hypothetical protein
MSKTEITPSSSREALKTIIVEKEASKVTSQRERF